MVASMTRSDTINSVASQALWNPMPHNFPLSRVRFLFRQKPIMLKLLLTSRYVQEPRATRTPEELSTRGAKHMAADLSNIYLQLSH